MLKALIRNKLGRRFDGQDDEVDDAADARDWLRRSEDALTSAVFARLLYLPVDRAHALMAAVVEGGVSVFGPDYPVEVRFWPSHRLAGSRVEPDVVIEHADRVVVVEVKWGAVHHAEQWRRELRAAAARYPGTRPLHLLVVGRQRDRADVVERVAAVARAESEWLARSVVSGWMSWEGLHAAVSVPAHAPPEVRAILRDVRLALEDRGLRRREALGSLAGVLVDTGPAGLLAAWPLTEPGGLRPLRALGVSTRPDELADLWRFDV